MSAPTTGEFLNQTTPPAPTGDQTVVFQSDGGTPSQSVTASPKRATGSLFGTVKPDGTSIVIAGGVISALLPTPVDNEILIVTSGPTIPALAHAPNPPSSLKLYWMGARQRYTTDFTVSGTTITAVSFTPSVGDNLIADYRY